MPGRSSPVRFRWPAVWGDLAVTDDSLTQCASEIRRALGADGARVLQTHGRRGYRMATRPRLLAPPAPSPAPDPVALPTPPASMPAGKPRRGPLNAAAPAPGPDAELGSRRNFRFRVIFMI
jgi:hypothetical protein